MSTEDLSYFQEEEFKKESGSLRADVTRRSVGLSGSRRTDDIAEYYLVQNDTDKAMACIQYALNIHPGSIDPLIFLARQKMFNGDIEGAKTIRDCITDPNDREVIFLNAELLLREGKEQEATTYLSEKSRNGRRRCRFVCIRHGYTVFGLRLFGTGSSMGTTGARHGTGQRKFLKLKADHLISSNRPKEAIEILNSLLDINPTTLMHGNSLGEAYFVCEDFFQNHGNC